MTILFYPDKEELLDELSSSTLFIGHDSGITKVNVISGITDETDLLNRILIPELIPAESF